MLDDYLRSVVSVSVQRTKVSSFDPHLMFVWTAHSEKGHES